MQSNKTPWTIRRPPCLSHLTLRSGRHLRSRRHAECRWTGSKPELPKEKQTTLGLYVTAKEAYEKWKAILRR